MKVVFQTKDVLQKLQQVASVINSKNSVQILSDICFMVRNGSVIATASDSETWVTERLTVNESEGECTFCVNAQDILKCLRSLDDEVVTLTLDEETKMLTCDYGNGKMNMPYENADDFPKPIIDMDAAYEIIISGTLLQKCIEMTQTAIANDELRPIMNGIHFDFSDGKMTCNACNFLKMVKYCDEIPMSDDSNGSFFTLPKKPSSIILTVISGIEEDVKLRFTDSAVSISNKDFKITARLLDGHYPNCDLIIPKDSNINVEVSNLALSQALKHVLSVDNSGNLVVLALNGNKLTVSAEELTLSKSATETIECKNNTEDEFAICFNGNIMLDMLRNIDDENVVIELSDPKKPAIMYAKDNTTKDAYLSLLMPMVRTQDVKQNDGECSTTNT